MTIDVDSPAGLAIIDQRIAEGQRDIWEKLSEQSKLLSETRLAVVRIEGKVDEIVTVVHGVKDECADFVHRSELERALASQRELMDAQLEQRPTRREHQAQTRWMIGVVLAAVAAAAAVVSALHAWAPWL